MFDETAYAGMDLEGLQGSDSADGLGAYARPLPETTLQSAQVPASPEYGIPLGPMPAYPMQPRSLQGPQGVHGKATWLEPDDTSSSANVRSAGVSVVFLAASFGLGVALGGPWGAAAGVLLAGVAMNGYRAQKWWSSQDASERYEAVSSAVFAVGGLAVGGYAAYKAYKAREKGESK